MSKIPIGLIFLTCAATGAIAQSQNGPARTTGTAAGVPYTKATNTYSNGGGTTTTSVYTPGNNKAVTPYVGTTVNDPHPNRERASGSATVGVSVPCCGR